MRMVGGMGRAALYMKVSPNGLWPAARSRPVARFTRYATQPATGRLALPFVHLLFLYFQIVPGFELRFLCLSDCFLTCPFTSFISSRPISRQFPAHPFISHELLFVSHNFKQFLFVTVLRFPFTFCPWIFLHLCFSPVPSSFSCNSPAPFTFCPWIFLHLGFSPVPSSFSCNSPAPFTFCPWIFLHLGFSPVPSSFSCKSFGFRSLPVTPVSLHFPFVVCNFQPLVVHRQHA